MAPHQGDIRCCEKNGGDAVCLILAIQPIYMYINISSKVAYVILYLIFSNKYR